MSIEQQRLDEAIRIGKGLLAGDTPNLTKLVSVLDASQHTLPGFATLDETFIKDIEYLIQELKEYIDDDTRKRPHNVLMLASPGSGKSHFVECLARELGVPFETGNLSVPDVSSVLRFVVNEARNYKAQDELPLLFLDEVDSHPIEALPLLLPLMWDGELFVSGQVLKVGRCIIICAASDDSLITGQSAPSDLGLKSNDFLSRFNSSPLNPISINSAARKLDKLCIAAALIRRRFPEVDAVSVGILRFLCEVQLQHEVRSLELIISMIPLASKKNRQIQLPPISPGDPTIALDIKCIEIDNAMAEKFRDLLTDVRHSPIRSHISDDLNWVLRQWEDFSRHDSLVVINKDLV